IAPGKRPMHTIMPGMMVRDGRAVMPFGVMGGGYQPFGHVHLLTNMIDFGMDPQQALDAPRVFYNHDVVEAERSVRPEPDHPLGGGQAVLIDWEKGTLTGASDPRKDGLALGY
ncbi:MAG: gamma-glutamyltransferase, partial [Mesorhizobium sp.]